MEVIKIITKQKLDSVSRFLVGSSTDIEISYETKKNVY